ncbi:unnamed protein product, partial [Menidia menidia]
MPQNLVAVYTFLWESEQAWHHAPWQVEEQPGVRATCQLSPSEAPLGAVWPLAMLTIYTYQNLAGIFSADGKSDAMNGQSDGSCVGHGLASPVVVLHGDVERHQPGLLGAQTNQLINTRPLEVVPAPIKGAVVWIPGGCARAVADRSAGTLPVQQRAFLVGRAGSLSAGHHAQSCVTHAQATASLVRPELLARLVVAALVRAAARFGGHTGAGAEDVTFVTNTGLLTGTLTLLLFLREWAGWLAGAGTVFIVAVTLAFHCWIDFVFIHNHIHLPDIGDGCVSPVIVALCSLEVKVETIERVVVGVTPGPAGTLATPSNTVITTLRIVHQAWHLPAATEGNSPAGLSARRGGEVITGITIEITTESTSLTTVTFTKSDHKVVIPVVTDNRTAVMVTPYTFTVTRATYDTLRLPLFSFWARTSK